MILVVGAGFAGATIARLLAESGLKVTVIDSRNHLGGNAYDYFNSHGELIHLYGPHLLHGDLNSTAIKWLGKFTKWTTYEHRVRAQLTKQKTTPLPVNRTTLEDVFGVKLHTDQDAADLLFQETIKITPSNTDELFLASVGQRLADIFFRPYTQKMWGVHPSKLEVAVGARLPVRLNRDDRYFSDSFQALPSNGYSNLFCRILEHDNIKVELCTPYEKKMSAQYVHTFASIAIDEYYEYSLGRLPYRSIMFDLYESSVSQEAPVINYTDTGIYTRCTQWDMLPNSGRRSDGLHTLTREIPCRPEDNNNQKFYPLRNKASIKLYSKYLSMAQSERNITFIGRTGLFKYIDMVPCVNIHMQIANSYCKELSK